MKPTEITHTTQLDQLYADALGKVADNKSFERFKADWGYWVSDKVKNMIWSNKLKNIIKHKKTFVHKPTDIAIWDLLLPERIFKVSMVAIQFYAPWGTAYKRMQEEKHIDY